MIQNGVMMRDDEHQRHMNVRSLHRHNIGKTQATWAAVQTDAFSWKD